MKKRLLNGLAILFLALSVVLVIWQGSFNFGEFGPSDVTQTFIYWAVSSLVFVLMVTLAFILARTALKLYIERRSNREGSRIRTKLMVGALALSSMPVFFLVLFSVHVLNVNLNKWFSKPVEIQVESFREMADALKRETREGAELRASLLVAQPEIERLFSAHTRTTGFLERFRKKHELVSVAVLPLFGTEPLDAAGPFPVPPEDGQLVEGRAPVRVAGATAGYAVVTARVPLEIARKQAEIERFSRDYGQLAANRKAFRQFYLLLISLITLFVVFVATWIARFLAMQISGPISALLHAAGEVRKGNLNYRVETRAWDELADLVRAFNAMTHDLEANRRELETRRRFTEAILESIPTGVISITADGSIKRVNRALSRIFPEPMVARAARLEDLFSREDMAEIKYMMKRARRTGAASHQLELKLDRQILHLSITVSALEEKLTSGFVLVLEDTSDLLRAQKSAAWNEVARRVAHEIKNPLTPIALSAERIGRHLDRMEYVPPETRRILGESAVIIANSVETVKTLVDEFSQFARFPSAHPARGDLNEVVESALAVFNGRLEGIEIETRLEPDLPAVNIDREQFKRVVVNLVDNAAEAMQDSLVKKLYIGTQAGAPDMVELVIADTGCGVTADDKEKLFLPYFSTKGRGTGLGLAIVRHIVSDHGAQIRVEDNEPAGARFTVEIPAILEPEGTSAQA
ncbi:MAG TPA: ATP-binding protein [Bryobacteraceae bacterium]|nr:ATP-binding protein [Bryobacteraceae bacterium]